MSDPTFEEYEVIADLRARLADAERDYADMRRFQAKYIAADQELRALREGVEALANRWDKMAGDYRRHEEHAHATALNLCADEARALLSPSEGEDRHE